MNTEGFTIYEGNPTEIIGKLMNEIASALAEKGLRPTGIHLLALAHLLGSVWKSNLDDPVNNEGAMPTFSTLLMAFVKSATGSAYSTEETKSYSDDFMKIVESLGGCKLPDKQKTTFMAPSSTFVH